jgi:hypothetical protein
MCVRRCLKHVDSPCSANGPTEILRRCY